MRPVVGTTTPERLKKISDVHCFLTRPEWYEIYRAAGNQLP